MQARTIRAWSWTHKWSSLISTLFLLMLCVTGLPLVFTHELDEVLLHEPWRPANPDGPLLNRIRCWARPWPDIRARFPPS